MAAEPIKSAMRTLALLEQFSRRQAPMSISEISAIMEMPQSSTSVLVKSLVTLGYLSHDDVQRTYYPTMRIALLGTWMRRRHSEVVRLPRMVSKLASATGESALVSMRNGIYTQHLFVQAGPNPLRLSVDSSMLFPLACTSAGWVLLSGETDNEIGKLIRRTQAEVENEHWRKTAGEALDRIRETRERGYAMTKGQTVEGVSSISVPLQARDNSIFAVGVGGPTARILAHQDEILETLRSTIDAAETDDVDDIVSASKGDALSSAESNPLPDG